MTKRPHLSRAGWRTLATAFVLASTLVLGGCVLTRQTNPLQVYAPVVDVEPRADWPVVDWQLMVIRPSASQMHDSQRILVRPEPARLQVYAGANWADSLPDMLHDVLLRAFEDSGRMEAVSRQSTGMRSRYALTLDIRSFEAVYGNGATPEADIQIHAKLIHAPSTRVVAGRTFRHRQASTGTDTASVVDAFTLAMGEFVNEVVGWTLEEGESAGPRLAEWREQRAREREVERASSRSD